MRRFSIAMIFEVLKPLGLTIKSEKAPVETFVIDYIERPSGTQGATKGFVCVRSHEDAARRTLKITLAMCE